MMSILKFIIFNPLSEFSQNTYGPCLKNSVLRT